MARLTRSGAIDASFDSNAGTDGTVFSLQLTDPYTAGLPSASMQLASNSAGGEAEEIHDYTIPIPANTPTNALSSGVLSITYDFLTLPDTMNVYLGTNQTSNNLIFSTGLTGGTRTEVIRFGPSPERIIRIVMNEGSGLSGTLWSYSGDLSTVIAPPDFESGEEIYIGGAFNEFDLRPRSKIARLNPNGSLDTSFDPGRGFDDDVYSVLLDTVNGEGRPICGGRFEDFNGTRRIGMARLLPNGTLDTPFMEQAYQQFVGLVRLDNSESKNFIWGMAINRRVVSGGTIRNDIMIAGSFKWGGGGFRDISNGTDPGFFGTDENDRRPAARSHRSDKVVGLGANGISAFPRADIRVRHNFTRVVGGEALGGGNIEFVKTNYEIGESGGNTYIALTRTNGNLGPAAVRFNTEDPPIGADAASAGSDYANTNILPIWNSVAITNGFRKVDFIRQLGEEGENTFLGDASGVFVMVADDVDLEEDERINLLLSDPSGGLFRAGEFVPVGVALGVSRSQLTIVDNDFNGVISFASNSFSVGEDGGSAAIVVIRTNGSQGTVSVDFSTIEEGGTAGAGVDYVAVSGTLSFGAGEVSKSFTIAIIDDNLTERNETILLRIFNPQGGATLGLANAVTLLMDNEVSTHFFVDAQFTVNEETPTASIPVARYGGTNQTTTVEYFSAAGTAVAGEDYEGVSGTLVFDPGETTKFIAISILDDSDPEPAESFTLRLTNSMPYNSSFLGVISNTTVSIIDNETEKGFIGFSMTNFNVFENAGFATITLTRTGGFYGSVSMGFVTAGATDVNPPAVAATPNVDFVMTNGVVDFADGEVSKNFRIAILDDQVLEEFEVFAVRLTTPGGGAQIDPGSSNATVLIIEDDPAGWIQFATNQITVSESLGVAMVVVKRVSGISGPVSVEFSTTTDVGMTNDPATEGNGFDYLGKQNLRVDFAHAQTNATVEVRVFDDGIIEMVDEAIGIRLANPIGGRLGFLTSGNIFIRDSAGRIEFSQALYTVSESDTNISIVLRRLGGSGGAVSIAVSSVDDTATAGTSTTGADFGGITNLSVAWPDRDIANRTIVLEIFDDEVFETTELAALQMGGLTGGVAIGSNTYGFGKSVLSIVDNDSSASGDPTGTIFAVPEKAGPDEILLRLSGEPGRLFRIQSSVDLRNWSDVGKVQSRHGQFEWTEIDISQLGRRFYRAVKIEE